MQAILLLKRNCIFRSFPKLTPISGLPHKEQFPNGTEKVKKYSFLQDLSCLFELYLEPLQKETFLTQDEVREYLKNGPVILSRVMPLALGFFIAESMTEKANDKNVNRNDSSWCPSLWFVHHFLFLKVNRSSELTAEKPSLFAWIFYKTCLKSINKDISSLCNLSLCYISLVHCFQQTTFRSMVCCTS